MSELFISDSEQLGKPVKRLARHLPQLHNYNPLDNREIPKNKKYMEEKEKEKIREETEKEWAKLAKNKSREELIRLNQEIENELDELEQKVKQEAVQIHRNRVNSGNPLLKTHHHHYLDRSEVVKEANRMYNSYEYMKPFIKPKQEQSVCSKYTNALKENCTIMFGGKRKTKKSIRKRKSKKGKKVIIKKLK